VHRWGLADVAGDSMAPTLNSGDVVLVRWGGKVAVGDVVVARRPDRPDLLVIKRIVRREGTRWWIEGDDPQRSDDSRIFGPVDQHGVVARVLVRWRPGRPRLIRRGPQPKP
jgi:nickel-type superoxide dismutase maturation protease